MKKILVTLLVCAMMASLCACGSKKEETPATEEVIVTEETTEVATEETEATTEAATDTAEGDTVTGIVTDASMNNLNIQAQDGSFYMFSEDDSTEINCADGILLGNVVDVTYTGTQDGGDAVAVIISDSDVKAKADREALEFAASLVQTIQFMDQENLADMITYPVYVCVGDIDETVTDAESFTALDRDTLFPEDLVDAVSEFNLFDLEKVEAGYVLGDGKPNVIFTEDSNNNFGFGVTGINEK